MNGILNGMPTGVLMDPRAAMMMQTGLGLMGASGPSRMPVSFGQALGQAGMQGLNAFQQAQKANQEQQLYNLKLAEVTREAEERKKKEQALTALRQDPRFANLGPLLDVAPAAAIERAIPKPLAPTKDDEFTRAMKAAGIQEGTPEWQRLTQERLKKLTTHAPAPSATARIDTKAGESLARPIGEIVQETRGMALGGIDQIESGRRITEALDSGKVITGPGTKARVFLKQLGVTLGVGGKDDAEILQNTRQVVKGLAEFTLGARKQLKGQGQVSDYEGKLIAQAASGEIEEMTEPEIRTVVSVADRLARKGYELHSRNLQTLRNKPEYADLADFYSVPELPALAGKPSAPKKGQVVDGWEFIGGDPANRMNWRKAR